MTKNSATMDFLTLSSRIFIYIYKKDRCYPKDIQQEFNLPAKVVKMLLKSIGDLVEYHPRFLFRSRSVIRSTPELGEYLADFFKLYTTPNVIDTPEFKKGFKKEFNDVGDILEILSSLEEEEYITRNELDDTVSLTANGHHFMFDFELSLLSIEEKLRKEGHLT